MKSISTRLFIGFFIVLFVMGFLAAVSISDMSKLRLDMTELSQHHAQELLMFGDLERLLFKMRMDLEAISSGAGAERIASYQEHCNYFRATVTMLLDLQQRFPDAYTDMVRKTLGGTPKKILFETNEENKGILVGEAIRQRADYIIVSMVDPLLRKCANLIVLEDREIVSVSNLALKQSTSSTKTIALLSSLGLLLSALMAIWTSQSITKPIRSLERVSVSIAEGDLTLRSRISRRDEIGRLSKAFDYMVNSLEKVLSEHEKFLSDASHNLLTPITVIQGHLQVMQRATGRDREGDGEVFDLIFKELGRIKKILNDLMLLAKSSSTDMLSLRSIAVRDFITEVFKKAEVLGERNWYLSDLPSVSIRCDADLITSSLLELAKNAVQHTRRGDRISFAASLSSGGIWFEVSDTGTGILEEEKDKIFHRFYRGVNGAYEKEGAGLGLSMVQSVASAHKGCIKVESVIGEGSTFRLWVPLDPFSSSL